MKILEKILRRTTLAKRVASLEEKVAQLSKKTISQTTTKTDEPPTPTQVLDEWLNGKDEDDA